MLDSEWDQIEQPFTCHTVIASSSIIEKEGSKKFDFLDQLLFHSELSTFAQFQTHDRLL